MPAVMIDSREPDYIQRQFPDAAVVMLDYGDAWVACDDGHMLLIERKTPEDFLNSVRDGRVFEQIAKLVDPLHTQYLRGENYTYWPYLVITGTFQPGANGEVHTGNRSTGWRWNSVQGALLTIQEMGCMVVSCHSDTEYGATVMALAKRDHNDTITIMPHRMPVLMDARMAFLCGLPGIGEERAKAILDWAGGILAHALVGLTDLEINAPVGKAVRSQIRGFLGLREKQTVELDLDDDGKEKLTIYEKEK